MKLWHQMAADARLLVVMFIMNIFLFICCALCLIALIQAPSHLTVYIPPDLTNGALLQKNTIPKPYLSEFAWNIWQLINDWPEDGDQDYLKNLKRYREYLDPPFYEELLKEYQKLQTQGEIAHRIRQIRPFAGHLQSGENVEAVNENTWNVDLKTELTEFVNGVIVKNKNLGFSLQVARADINPHRNPFGLILLGFSKPPYLLEEF